MNNNALDNVNSLNNILCNIEISYNKQNIVFYCISQLACYIRIINIFVILDHEMPADSAVYLFTQNYTQTAIACRENKLFISIEMYFFRCVLAK